MAGHNYAMKLTWCCCRWRWQRDV